MQTVSVHPEQLRDIVISRSPARKSSVWMAVSASSRILIGELHLFVVQPMRGHDRPQAIGRPTEDTVTLLNLMQVEAFSSEKSITRYGLLLKLNAQSVIWASVG